MESGHYKKECAEIKLALKGYAHTWLTMHGYPSLISLDKFCSLVLPPDLYNSLYQPPPMALPLVDNPRKERLLDNDDDDDDMMPAAALGCSVVPLCMRNFAATSMEQENKTDWDSESDQPSYKF